MRFGEYQKGALETAISNNVKPQKEDLARFILGLADESGEVAGKLKKYKRGDYEYPELKSRLIDELGDVLWYWSIVAYCIGVHPEEIARKNYRKLQDRHSRGKIKGDGDDR